MLQAWIGACVRWGPKVMTASLFPSKQNKQLHVHCVLFCTHGSFSVSMRGVWRWRDWGGYWWRWREKRNGDWGLSYGCLNTLLSIADLCRSEGKGPKRASWSGPLLQTVILPYATDKLCIYPGRRKYFGITANTRVVILRCFRPLVSLPWANLLPLSPTPTLSNWTAAQDNGADNQLTAYTGMIDR